MHLSGNMSKKDENEDFYVAARILEASAKSESDTSSVERATVYARAAERARRGKRAEGILDDLSEDVSAEAESAVETLRLAVDEIEREGRAQIVDEVDDAVVARLRSEYD